VKPNSRKPLKFSNFKLVIIDAKATSREVRWSSV